MNIVLWVVQVLLALVFLFAGISKAVRPLDTLSKQMTWVPTMPPAFVRFVGVAEILAAIGLILPLATNILPGLTVAAAVGGLIVMIGAVILHAVRQEPEKALGNVPFLLIALLIVVGRLVFVPIA